MRVRKHGVARVACLSRINTITPHGSLLPYMQMREIGGPTTGAAVSPRPPSFLRRWRRVSVSASRRGRRSALIGLRMGNDVGGDVTHARSNCIATVPFFSAPCAGPFSASSFESPNGEIRRECFAIRVKLRSKRVPFLVHMYACGRMYMTG